MSDTPTLATSRLTLRPLTPDDAAALLPAMADPAVMRWWSRGPFSDEAKLRRYFADRAAGVHYWAVTDAAAVIGFVFSAERRSGVSEIGYLVRSEHWGRGLAREAVSAVISHLFASGTRRIFADVDPDAQASARLLERLGFVCEGRLREEWQTHIGIRDTLLYALLAREWRG